MVSSYHVFYHDEKSSKEENLDLQRNGASFQSDPGTVAIRAGFRTLLSIIDSYTTITVLN